MDTEEETLNEYFSQCQHNGAFAFGSFPNTPGAAAYVVSLWGGSIGGILLAVLVIILVSLPLCCGLLKHYRKAIGAVGIVLGTVALWIPSVVAIASCGPFVDGLCQDLCGSPTCEYQFEVYWAESCPMFGIVYAYVMIFGWAACILGVVGLILACCVCCKTGKSDSVHTPASPVPFSTLGRQSEVE